MKSTKNEDDFAGAREVAKLARQISNMVRRARLDYEGFRRLCAHVRKEAGLRRPPRSRRLPHILTEVELARFFGAIQGSGNLQHEIMLKLLLFTAVRVSELTNICIDQVDLDACKIFILSGKGDKDRYILFPDGFRLVLKSYMSANPRNRYLFESRQRARFSARRVQQIVADYAAAAGLSDRIHPHLLRHQMLTWLTSQGMPDAQIMLISGHASKKSLEIYQHLSLGTVQPAYQKALKELPIT
jgi:site-specific recombinase XerD